MTAVATVAPERTMLDHALAIIGKVPGARVFPVKAGAKFPPLLEAWPHKASRDPEQIRRWWAQHPNANIGLTGVVGIDIDTKGGKPGVASFEALALPEGTSAEGLWVKTPSGGRHLIFQQPDGIRIPSCNGWREGIDIKADAGYVLGPGSRLIGKDGGEIGRYEIHPRGDRVPGPCPAMLVDLLGEKLAKPERKDRAARCALDTAAAIECARLWLSMQEPAIEGQGGNQHTYTVACGIRDFGVSEAAACDLMLDSWNEGCAPCWEPDELCDVVAHAYSYAQNAAGVRSPAAEFSGVDIPTIDRKPRDKGRWRYRHGDPITIDQQWLFFERLPLIGTAMIVGPSGGGKSFFCADLARAVAAGEAFFGAEPDERGGVALFAAEGVAGTPARLSVLADRPLPIWADPVANLRAKDEQRRIFELLDEAQDECRDRFDCPLRVIVIDTLAASGLLEDENDNSQCAEAVKFLGQLAEKYGCLVLVTHHPPKKGTGARGGSALHAGFDTVIEIHHDGKSPVRKAECTKGRDAPTGDWGCFTLIPHELGIDARGRKISTCTLSTADADPRAGAALYIDPVLVDAIVAAAGNKTWRKDAQSETSIIDVIAKCADIDLAAPAGRRQARQYLGALLASGTLVEALDPIRGKNKPVVFVPGVGRDV